MDLQLNNVFMKTILITGASSGMGREMAIEFSHSFNVVLCGRNRERLDEVSNLCNHSTSHYIWQYDLSKIEELEQSLTSFISENNLDINYYVHCAGLMKNYPLKMVTIDQVQETYNTNVFSAVLISKVLTTKKINGKNLENIVFVSSNISGFGAKAHSIYGSSKGALDNLMKSLAMELAPSIRVNSVLPGAVHTPLTEHVFEDEELASRMERSYPLGFGSVTDIYKAVKFLLSDESHWITGQQLTVDGGRTINITG